MSVFIIQEPRSERRTPYDINPCIAYGQPVYVLSAQFNPGQMPGRALAEIRRKLTQFDPKADFILWAGGDPLALALTSGYLLEKFGCFRWLRYERNRDRVTGHYVPVDVQIR